MTIEKGYRDISEVLWYQWLLIAGILAIMALVVAGGVYWKSLQPTCETVGTRLDGSTVQVCEEGAR
jgi:hypothetical protein